MSYEIAPSTIFLATHCACCGKKLRDSKSVEIGMGPVCRAEHGFNVEVSEAARDEANKIIHHVALTQKGIEVWNAAQRLRELGFVKLAGIIQERARIKAQIKITAHHHLLRLEAPYNANAVAELKKIPGRSYSEREETDEKGKVVKKRYNFIPAERRAWLFDILKENYSGLIAEGPKGFFTL